jgi:hypothetical protein
MADHWDMLVIKLISRDQACSLTRNARSKQIVEVMNNLEKPTYKKKTWIQENDKRTKSIERQQHQKRNKRKEKLEEQHFKTEKKHNNESKFIISKETIKIKAKTHSVFTVDLPLSTMNFNSKMIILYFKKLSYSCLIGV